MSKLIALAFVLLALAGCVQLPEEEVKPPAAAQKEEAPQQNITDVPVAEPVALPPANMMTPSVPQNATNPLAPLPKANTSAVIHTTTVVKNSTAPASSGWTTEPLQIQEGQTLRVVLQKPK